jgi:hypothetical protein
MAQAMAGEGAARNPDRVIPLTRPYGTTSPRRGEVKSGDPSERGET